MTTIYVDNIAPNLQSKISAPNLTLPAGSVVQVKSFATTAQITFNSTSAYTNALSGNITTQYANSIIMVQGIVPWYAQNSNAGVWTNSAYLQLQEGSTTVTGFEHPGPQTSMEFSMCVPFQYTSTQKSVGTYTYTIQIRPTTSGDTFYLHRQTNGPHSATRMTLMEIAQ